MIIGSFLFFTGLVAVLTVLITRKDDHSSSGGYFLAGRSLSFPLIAGHPDRNLVVELSKVERFDTAAMAVLLEGLMLTHEQGPEVYLVGASDAVTKVFRLAGFEEALLRCFGCMNDVHQQIKH